MHAVVMEIQANTRKRSSWIWGMGLLVIALTMAACGTSSAAGTSPASTTAASTATDMPKTQATAITATSSGTVSLLALPLGDGKVGSTLQVGYVVSCMTSFGNGLGLQARWKAPTVRPTINGAN